MPIAFGTPARHLAFGNAIERVKASSINKPLTGYNHATKQFTNANGELANEEDAIRAHILANRSALLWTSIE